MIGLPKLGASASRTFLGITLEYTFGPKYSRASAATWRERLSRASYMVSSTPSIERSPIHALLHQMHRIEQLRQALQRVVLALHRDEQRIGRGEHVDGDEAERRGAVDQDVVILGCNRRERIAHGLVPPMARDQLHFCPGKIRRGWDHVQVRELHAAVPRVAGRRVSEQEIVDGRFNDSRAIPMPLVAFPCGSPSISSVRCSAAARLAARFTAVVVFPTPPFWFAIASTWVTGREYSAGIRRCAPFR